MIDLNRIAELIGDYDLSDVVIATVCSHSSLQIFDGARREGFKTLGLCIGNAPRFYDAFPRAKPDEFLCVDSYADFLNHADELTEKNVILIPHGSLVEYLGHKNFEKLEVPTFGNRRVLEWEIDREKQRTWLGRAGITMPRKISDPSDIKGPVMVKYHGAKGGRGFFVAKTHQEFEDGIDNTQPYTIQEFILGTRYYLHYFHSPIVKKGYQLSNGTLEMLSMDRRVESNADEIFRLGSPKELESSGINPTFVVTGNMPLVARESLMPKIFEMGEAVVEESIKLFGGMIGPFCLETVLTDKLEFRVFELSARIVAGTNFFVSGSPYADLIYDNMSTGRRIAREIKLAIEQRRLQEIIS
ncbi:MAG: 5-formaminoimidazole-4-carboxamide-1-(beta)-D-ribofuranosyl 5'-monophosphate synthetase [Candidatus Argoarchaeum ethanivorans]|uniref:5-formaminoimidazole-4-carboxamide-1-(beta)-D-ribofuranosyl 5'-monophosphate synthetase n=1 Tax=Candidatus Argoarchaeum ethanivorans TaxID=2608793 RepID=A0A8B3S1U8_9EURY|nr:MAG: 5-formaminoimidazole-4-carboxamide-1-(beta)-D-ribofuranosyl 5'-monophosphate synthetase [Candidatus Argoarchaeum ethanivorans]